MYVEDILNSKGVLLFRANTVVTDMAQVERLRNHGVKEVCINTTRSEAALALSEIPSGDFSRETIAQSPYSAADAAEYKRAVSCAKMVKARTVTLVKNCMISAQRSRSFASSGVEEAISMLVDEVVSMRDVFFAVCRMQAKDDPLYEHSVNVCVIAAALAHSMGLSKETVVDCAVGALFHDIGMLRIPEHIRKKTGKFTQFEYDAIRLHPQLGVSLLEQTGNFSATVRAIVYQHHERFNGSGYPEGLRNHSIEPEAMICAIADVFDSLTNQTEHRKECLPQEAVALIFQGIDEEYPVNLVDALVKLLGIYPVGSFVKLKSGEIGMVFKNDHNNLMAPFLIMCLDSRQKPLKQTFIRNLASNRNGSVSQPWRIESIVNPSEYDLSADSVLGALA